MLQTVGAARAVKTLSEVLVEMHHWLENVAPDEMNEPASASTVAKLNEAYGGRVPEDVLKVYAWHDGGQIPDPWWELIEIDQVVRIKDLHASMPDLHEETNWWRDSWVPIGADDDGNHLCVDLDGCFDGVPGQLLVFLHDDRERRILAPSLRAYLETLLSACQDGILEFDEEEGFQTDQNQDAWTQYLTARMDGYPKMQTAGD